MTTAIGPAALAAHLRAGGHLTDDWTRPFTAVRRGDFLPDQVWIRGYQGYYPLNRADEPEAWMRAAYDDTPVVTQVEDPGSGTSMVPSSAASMPRVVADMLTALSVNDGHRVLEVGTGTGYNTALLSERLGPANVTSIEIDPDLASTARSRLTAAGYPATVITGDGADGWAPGGPYDRIVVTCALSRLPFPLIEQTVPGGIIVTPWGTGLYNGVLVRLTVTDEPQGRSARGPVIGDSAFMWMRTHAPADRDVMAAVHNRGLAAAGTTRLDPRYVLGDENAAFATGIELPTVRYAVGHGDGGVFTVWFTDPDGSWACIDYQPGAERFDVQQYGPRHLWDEVETAYRMWRRAGQAARTRYQVTVAADGHHTWTCSEGTAADSRTDP